MKSLFKLFGIAVLSTTALFFAACGDDPKPPVEETIAAPTNLNANVTTESVVFTWAGSEENYELEVGETSYQVKGLTHTLEDLSKGTYSWRVRAVKSGKFSDWVSGKSFVIEDSEVDPTLPKVTGLGVEKVAANFAVIKFSRITDITDFEVEIAGKKVTVKDEGKTSKSSLYCYSPSMLDPSKTYQYKVRYKKDDKYSEWSETKEFSTLTAAPANVYAKVTFEKEGLSEYWWVGPNDGSVIGDAVYNEKTGYITFKMVSITGTYTPGDMGGHRQIEISLPAKIGTHKLEDINGQNAFLDYAEYSTYSPTQDYPRSGNWWSDEGTVTLESFTDGKDGEKPIKFVSGSGTATVYEVPSSTTIVGKLSMEFKGINIDVISGE